MNRQAFDSESRVNIFEALASDLPDFTSIQGLVIKNYEYRRTSRWLPHVVQRHRRHRCTANGTVVYLVGPLMGIHLEKIGNDGTKRLQDFLLPFVVGGAPMHKLS